MASFGPGELGICRYFLRGYDCTGRCNGVHTARPERPPCPRWVAGSAHGGCSFKDDECFFPHVLPQALRTRHDTCRCAIEVYATHSARAAAFFTEELSCLGLTSVVECRAHGDTLKSNRLLLLLFHGPSNGAAETDSPNEAVVAWLQGLHGRCPFVSTALVRCFVVCAVRSSLEEVTAYLGDRLIAAAHQLEGCHADDDGGGDCGDGGRPYKRRAPGTAATAAALGGDRAALRVRVHAFPRALAAQLATAVGVRLDAAFPAAAPAGDTLSDDTLTPGARRPSLSAGSGQCGCVLSCASAGGSFYASVQVAALSPALRWAPPPPPQPSGQGDSGGGGKDSSAAVCRAEHKLREVARRLPKIFGALAPATACTAAALASGVAAAPHRRRVAMDIGSSPGGWTSCLLGELGFDLVFAVDPGDMDPAVLSMGRGQSLGQSHKGQGGGGARGCEHLRMLGAAAVAELKARVVSAEPSGGGGGSGNGGGVGGGVGGGESGGESGGEGGGAPFLAALVQDANCRTGAALDDFEAARPLLLPGAAVVITLKNFDGKPRLWAEACAKAEARLRHSCGHVQLLHLFRNGPVETTLVGVYRGEDGECGDEAR